jgi:hypothetical protein
MAINSSLRTINHSEIKAQAEAIFVATSGVILEETFAAMVEVPTLLPIINNPLVNIASLIWGRRNLRLPIRHPHSKRVPIVLRNFHLNVLTVASHNLRVLGNGVLLAWKNF